IFKELLAFKARGAAVPDGADEPAEHVADTGRHQNQSDSCAKAEGRDLVRRRYHVQPKNKVNQPLCSADPDQKGPEAMPKGQEDSESKTKRMRVDAIHSYHLSFLCSLAPNHSLNKVADPIRPRSEAHHPTVICSGLALVNRVLSMVVAATARPS